MNRLQAELQRLYDAPPDAALQPQKSPEPSLAGAHEQVRALVLELARPASWDLLRKVWQGVQAELELPAPAIAVSGIDAYQLWFSLAAPVPVAQAAEFLVSLRRHYLGDVAAARIRLTPCGGAEFPAQASGIAPGDAALIAPPIEAAPGQWSAFVASDLAPLFADEPWLDIPPSPDAQADLLSRLRSTAPADLKRAQERLAQASASAPSAVAAQDSVVAAAAAAEPADAPAAPKTPTSDPRCFLLEIMNDPAVPLHLRIDAAKALLPYPAAPTE